MEATDQAKAGTDTARDAVGRAAKTSGAALDRAGQAVKDWVAPATRPTTRPAAGPTAPGVPAGAPKPAAP